MAQQCYGLNPEGPFSLVSLYLTEVFSLSLSISESVSRYLGVVLAGLAGSAHMVSATVISLSHLLFEFHGQQ